MSNLIAQGWTPLRIPGCKLWYDAADITSMFSDTGGTTQITQGGTIARWNDKSGNNNYLQQATAGSRPVYQNTPGNYNGVYFVNTPIQMTTINNSPVTGNSSRTIFLIQQAGSITRVGTGPHTTTSPPNTFGIDNNTPITTLWCPYVYAGADNTIAVSITALAEIWVYYDASVSQIGGNYNFSTAQTQSTTLNTSATPWYFGLRPDTAGSVNSYICEFIMYDTFLTTAQRQQVEGYLAWKWGLNASLPSGHAYLNAPPPGSGTPLSITNISISNLQSPAAFLPTQIAGCAVWLDAADTTTQVLSVANITQWNDKSGNNNNFTTTSGTITVGADGAYPNVVIFPNSLTYMTSASSVTFTTTSSVFIVAKVTNVVGGAAAQMLFTGISINGQDYSIRYNSSGLFGGGTSTTDIGTSSTYYTTGTPGVTGSLGAYQSYHIVDTVFSAGGTSQFTLSSPFQSNRYWYGTVAEVIVYTSALKPVQRQQVEGYLAWKWGIQANLPSTQSYKSIAPRSTLLSTPLLPTDIGLALWLDGADPLGTGTAPASGAIVTTWYDKSGNSRNATGTNSPLFVAFGGVSLVNASSQYFALSVPYVSTHTIYIVATTSAQSSIYLFGRPFPGGGPTILLNYAGVSLEYYDNSSSGRQTLATTPTSTYIASYIRTLNTSVVGRYNGSQVFTEAGPTSEASALSWGSLGNTQPNGGNFTGTIYEFMIFNYALTTSQAQQIEGYLAWKWGLKANLPLSHPYYYAPTYSGTAYGNISNVIALKYFNPTTISGLQLWVDAADISTYTSSSSISSWTNKGVAGGTVTTTSGTVGSKSFTQNKFPMMSFGTSAYMTAPSLTFSQTSRTAFAVVNIGAAGVGRTFLASTGGTSTVETTLNSYYPGSYTDIQISYYANVQYQTQTPSPFFNTTSIVSAVSAPSTAAGGGIWVNGTSQSLTLTPSAPNYGTGTTTNQILGSAASFNMGEVLLFDGVISVVDRQKVEGYLAWKWGLQASLPSTHPWFSYPPPP